MVRRSIDRLADAFWRVNPKRFGEAGDDPRVAVVDIVAEMHRSVRVHVGGPIEQHHGDRFFRA